MHSVANFITFRLIVLQVRIQHTHCTIKYARSLRKVPRLNARGIDHLTKYKHAK